MTRGQTGALNYAIPLNQQQVMQSQAIPQPKYQGYDYELPDDLAVIEEKTSQLFNNYGLLKRFIDSMRQQGIDPFTPDYTQEGGGQPYKSLMELDAGVRYAAQELKNEQEFRKQLDPYRFTNRAGYAPGINPQTDLLSQDPNSVISYEAMPFVTQANQRLNTPTYTQGDQNKFNQAYYDPNLARIDEMVRSGQMTEAQAAVQRANLQPNVSQTAYQQLIPRSGRGGLTQEDISRRAELIKQVKNGITNNDQTPINMLKLVPGVEDVQYINTGDEVGLEVYFKNQQQPAFIDLSQGGGEGDINALLNRIEGQKNVPNEAVFTFDTKVNIPQSNVKPIIDNLKNTIKTLPSEFIDNVLPKLQELALDGGLQLPTGEQILSIEHDGPYLGFIGKNELKVKYRKDKNKEATKYISSPEELEALININANSIAPVFGGGFGNSEPQLTPEQQRAQELINKYLPK